MKVSEKFLGIACLVFAPLMWAGNLYCGRAIHGAIPPWSLAFYRWLLVVIFLIPYSYKDIVNEWPAIKKQWPHLIVLGLFGTTLTNYCVYWGLTLTDLISAGILSSLVPAIILLISAPLFKEKLTMKKITALFLSLLGAAIIISHGDPLHIFQMNFNQGDIAILISVLTWAIFTVYYRWSGVKLSPFVYLLAIAIVGVVSTLPGFVSDIHHGYMPSFSWPNFLSIVYISLFSSILAYMAWDYGVDRVGSSTAGYFFNLLPLFSALLGIFLLGEKFYLYELFGFAGVIVGIYLSKEKS